METKFKRINPLNKVNFCLAIFNLMNAILGSGILGLAYATKNLGIGLYILMLMMVAGLAFYAISLLLDMCEITGKRVSVILNFIP